MYKANAPKHKDGDFCPACRKANLTLRISKFPTKNGHIQFCLTCEDIDCKNKYSGWEVEENGKKVTIRNEIKETLMRDGKILR